MALEFRETFQVGAPVDSVWHLLLDPSQVVLCMPGASLLGAEDERTYLGQVLAKVGPVTTTYVGRATFTEVDHVAHRARIVGEGKEGSGGGSARMTIVIDVRALSAGTEVELSLSVDVVGRVMQLGRGMLESVARQLLRRFIECIRGKLEALSAKRVIATEVTEATPSPAPLRPVQLMYRAFIEWLLTAVLRRQAPR
ncbi:MAG TPA: SRPBCC family protein [Gemmatimonadaceae bacterium]